MAQTPTLAGATDVRPAPSALAGSSWAASLALGVFAALVVAAPLLAVWRAHAPATLEDDGFYYAQIARHLARSGRSTFDGIGLTNGYHPLWLLVLAVKTRLFGDGIAAIVLIEAACVGGASALIVRSAGVRAWGSALVFTALFTHYVGAMAGLGMEVSLFALCAAAFIALLASTPRHGVVPEALTLGAAAAACIAARIDAAVFVIPILALAPRPGRTRVGALAAIALAGLAYAVVNLALFASALPISSAVKSLGGVQLNRRFLAQMAVEAHAFGRNGGGRMLLTLAACAGAPLAALAAPRGSAARALGFGTAIGGALFLAKLLFDSSWQIWPWYSFPLVFALAAILLALGPRLDDAPRPVRLAVLALGALALAFVGARAVRAALGPPPAEGFYAINREAAARAQAITGGAPVAMGDRAGSFAWFYPGPVVQLEGLVNDARWLRLLRRREAPLPELCRRGVRFVAAYTPELSGYGSLSVPMMRPSLTQFPSAALTVRQADEVMSVEDRAAFDGDDLATDGDPVFRLWRLPCGGSAVAPAPPAAGLAARR